MTARLTLSEILAVQEARIDRLSLMLESALEALTERRTASETVTLKRIGTGPEKITTAEVSAVTRNGEGLHDAAERARIEYERLAARFPLASGAAHVAPLGDLPEDSA